MKLHAKITELAIPKNNDTTPSIIFQLIDDKNEQNFEVFCHDFDPYHIKIRKWDILGLSIKWKSEIFTDPLTQKNSYFTHLICTKAVPVFQMQN